MLPRTSDPITIAYATLADRARAGTTALNADAALLREASLSGDASLSRYLSRTADLLSLCATAIAAVLGEIQNNADIALIGTTRLVALSGARGYMILANRYSGGEISKADIMRTAATLHDAFCTLMVSSDEQQQVTQFGSLYGASTASSVSGGKPRITDAAFASLIESEMGARGTYLSTAALARINQLRIDPLAQADGIEDVIPAYLKAIVDGVVVP